MTPPSCVPHGATLAATLRRLRRGVAFVAGLAPLVVLAQVNPASTPRPAGPAGPLEFGGVFRRLDSTALLLLALAALFVLWFLWRMVRMIGRDRVAPPRRTTSRPTVAPEGAPPEGATDWGFDENKRAAGAGRKDRADDGLPPRIETSTMIPALERSGVAIGILPDDALGRSPIATVSPYRTGTNPYYLRDEALENQIDVEEVADVLTQADLLVQLGDPKEAMNLLSRHIRETEKPGPQVWLMLLDLYRSTGREAQYAALGDGFRALFNAQVPPWTANGVADRALESYPQVMRRVIGSWPNAECRMHLEALLNDDRGGSRQGFSLYAYREILFLVDLLDARALIDRDEVERKQIAQKLSVT